MLNAVRRIVHVDVDSLVRVNALREVATVVDLDVGVVLSRTKPKRVGQEGERLVGILLGNQTTADVEAILALAILIHEEADKRLATLVLVKVGPVDVELVREHRAVACT